MSEREDKVVSKLLADFGLAPRFLALAKQHQRMHGGRIADILVEKGFLSRKEVERARDEVREELRAARKKRRVTITPRAESEPAESASGRERRRQRRVTAPPDFSISIEELTGAHSATLRDLSRGGFAVEVERNVRVGRVLAVHVRGPGGTKVSCVAKVRHVRRGDAKKHFLGLELVAVNPVQQLAVEALYNAAKREEEEILDLRWLD